MIKMYLNKLELQEKQIYMENPYRKKKKPKTEERQIHYFQNRLQKVGK